MAVLSGAIAAINASFFEMNTTNNPMGIVIHDGELLKSAKVGREAVAGFTAQKIPYFGSLLWQGEMHILGSTTVMPLHSFNTTDLVSGQTGLYQLPWMQSFGHTHISLSVETGQIVEVVLRKCAPCTDSPQGKRIVRAQVLEVRVGQPGIPIAEGQLVITDLASPYQANLVALFPGDEVDIAYSLTPADGSPPLPDWRHIQYAVAAGVVLLRNGAYGAADVQRSQSRDPRTAIAVDQNQQVLYWVVVEGRNEDSVGITYQELADFLLHAGAYDAINLDGGGSSTLVVKHPETNLITLVNKPTDGLERYVPDALGLFVTQNS